MFIYVSIDTYMNILLLLLYAARESEVVGFGLGDSPAKFLTETKKSL